MLEFKTATKKGKKARKLSFTIDDEEFSATAPKDSMIAMLVASGASDDPSEQIHEVLVFFKHVLDEDSATRFFAKMRDKEDRFDIEDAVKVLQGLLTEFGGRPTE